MVLHVKYLEHSNGNYTHPEKILTRHSLSLVLSQLFYLFWRQTSWTSLNMCKLRQIFLPFYRRHKSLCIVSS